MSALDLTENEWPKACNHASGTGFTSSTTVPRKIPGYCGYKTFW